MCNKKRKSEKEMVLRKKGCLITILAVFCLLLPTAFSQENSPPTITSFSINPLGKEIGENSAFELSVNAMDPDGDTLTYAWYYAALDRNINFSRDKHTAISASKMRNAEKKQEFKITATVSDGKGGIASISDTVKIKEEQISIIVTPAMDPLLAKLNKGDKVKISIRLNDESGQIIKNVRKIEAEIKGQKIKLQQNALGTYEGEFQSSKSFKNVEMLNVYVEMVKNFKIIKQKDSFPFYFNPISLEIQKIELEKEGKLFFGSKLGKITIKPFYPDSNEFAKGIQLHGTLKSNGKTVEQINFTETENAYYAESNYSISRNDLELGKIGEEKGLWLWLEGQDEAENGIFNESYGIKTEKENPNFRIKMENPIAEKNVFNYGQTIEFKARVLSKEKEIKNARVFISSKEFNIDEEMLPTNEGFKLEFTFPEESKTEKGTFLILAEGTVNGEKMADFREITVELGKGVNIEFFNLKEGSSPLNAGENTLKEIEIIAKYFDGSALREKEIPAIIEIDGKKIKGSFKRTPMKGKYIFLLDTPILAGTEEHTISVELLGDFKGNKATIKTKIITQIEPSTIFFFAAIIVLSIFGVYFIFSRMKTKAMQLEKLLSKKTKAKATLKQLKIDYLKRRISEEEFKKRVLEKEQEIATIDQRIQKKTKKIVSEMKEAKEKGKKKSRFEELKLPSPAKLIKEKPFKEAVKERIKKREEEKAKEIKIPPMEPKSIEPISKKEKAPEEKLIQIISAKKQEKAIEKTEKKPESKISEKIEKKPVFDIILEDSTSWKKKHKTGIQPEKPEQPKAVKEEQLGTEKEKKTTTTEKEKETTLPAEKEKKTETIMEKTETGLQGKEEKKAEKALQEQPVEKGSEKRIGFFSKLKSKMVNESIEKKEIKKVDTLDWYTEMQVKKLVKLLAKKKENYSKEEIFSIIVEQGYLPEVAQKVVEEIYS